MPGIFDTDGNPIERHPHINGKKYTHIGIALDKSGSMSSMIDPTIRGFNEWIETIKSNAYKGGETDVTLVTFGGEIHTDFRRISPQYLRPLSKGTYRPNGNTPMYSAIAVLLNELEEYDTYAMTSQNNVAFLIIIISDGEENASPMTPPYADRNAIASRINRLKNSGRWTFAYVGANQDVYETQVQIAIPSVLPWTYTIKGTGTVYGIMSSSTARYFDDRNVGITYTNTFFDQTAIANSGEQPNVIGTISHTDKGTP